MADTVVAVRAVVLTPAPTPDIDCFQNMPILVHQSQRTGRLRIAAVVRFFLEGDDLEVVAVKVSSFVVGSRWLNYFIKLISSCSNVLKTFSL